MSQFYIHDILRKFPKRILSPDIVIFRTKIAKINELVFQKQNLENKKKKSRETFISKRFYLFLLLNENSFRFINIRLLTYIHFDYECIY